jgi:hypothetical protein
MWKVLERFEPKNKVFDYLYLAITDQEVRGQPELALYLPPLP